MNLKFRMMSVSLDVITSKSSVVDVGGRINVTASSVLIRRTTLLCDVIQLLKSVTSSVALNSTRIHDGDVGITFSMCGRNYFFNVGDSQVRPRWVSLSSDCEY
jgi:hypothetical protein